MSRNGVFESLVMMDSGRFRMYRAAIEDIAAQYLATVC